jgi:hypothetical protein
MRRRRSKTARSRAAGSTHAASRNMRQARQRQTCAGHRPPVDMHACAGPAGAAHCSSRNARSMARGHTHRNRTRHTEPISFCFPVPLPCWWSPRPMSQQPARNTPLRSPVVPDGCMHAWMARRKCDIDISSVVVLVYSSLGNRDDNGIDIFRLYSRSNLFRVIQSV